MEAIIQLARVYGSQSQYGKEARTTPPETPLIFDNYPLFGDRAIIQMGEPNTILFRAIRVGQAIGRVALRGLIGELPGNPQDNALILKKEVEELLGHDEELAEATTHNWYITISIERRIDLESEALTDNEYFWIAPDAITKLDREFESYTKPHVDLIASYLTSVIPQQYFEQIIINDRVFFHSTEKPSFTLPRMQVGGSTARAMTINQIENLDITSLRNILSSTIENKNIVLSALPLGKILELMERAETADFKGKALEELVARLFATVDGFTIGRRVKTATEEIDISILNDSNDLRLRREGALIIAECKNWSEKCGKNEFVILREKMENRNRRCTLAYLVSWNGFAETVTKEMLRGSREEMLIVPLTGTDIREAVNGKPYIEVLNSAWERAVNL